MEMPIISQRKLTKWTIYPFVRALSVGSFAIRIQFHSPSTVDWNNAHSDAPKYHGPINHISVSVGKLCVHLCATLRRHTKLQAFMTLQQHCISCHMQTLWAVTFSCQCALAMGALQHVNFLIRLLEGLSMVAHCSPKWKRFCKPNASKIDFRKGVAWKSTSNSFSFRMETWFFGWNLIAEWAFAHFQTAFNHNWVLTFLIRTIYDGIYHDFWHMTSKRILHLT